MKKLFTLLAIVCFQFSFAQTNKLKQISPPIINDDVQPHKSIHQLEAEKYTHYNLSTDAQWDSLRGSLTGKSKSNTVKSNRTCTLNKRVYGWHPYWSNGLQTNYNWADLTDLCFFAYEVNSANGNAISTHNWATAQVVTDAQSNGVNVTLCATLFSGHTAFFASSTAKQTLISNLISLVQSRNAHGVNIDFEGMTASNSAGFTAFMIDLCNQMHAAVSGSEVSIALYSVDFSNVFDMSALNPYVDLFIIMGYDYYYSGSSTAGPEDPLYNFQTSFNYTLTKSITYYLNKGASRSKLLLGLPYYGREWSTAAGTIPSSTSGSSNTVLFNSFKNNSSGNYGNRHWDANSFSTWYPSQRSGQWWQCFIEDAYSMSKRFDVVNQQGIGGIGIWALGYDDGYNDFWDLIKNKFTDCAIVPCTDTIYDMGGPNRNYNDNEKYTYTIAPANATGVTLNFSSFATEANSDSLWIYDGASTSSPLIGAYTGTNSPGTVTSSGGALTIRFKSDVATAASGWQAIWNCSSDLIVPTTQVAAPTNWVTQNFTTSFTDADNSGGSGIEKSFYQVLDYNGTEWRANNGNGFFSDNFDVAIHPDWTIGAGTWAINGGYLEQSDQTNTNTNIYAHLTQNLSNRYLYNWQGKINGTGTNRRAGFHFFCDDATQTNRGNSYFVWFRADQSQLQIYKVANNVFGSPAYTASITVNANTWYDYKVLYDRISGKMDVYMNNTLVGSWTDTAPYSNGNSISFRSGECDYLVNDLKVYRSRPASVTVSVGAASTNDVRYQNSNPATPSCRVKSITKDGAGNLSPVASQNVNIDWTVPTSFSVNDGTASDIDTSYSLTQLSANWTISADTNSGLIKYWYAIGTTAGATDVVNWTDNGLNTSVTKTGLSLLPNQYYYFAVKSEDSAGLQTIPFLSNGQIIKSTITSINEQTLANSLSVYPNPFTGSTNVRYRLSENTKLEISLSDVLGKKIVLFNNTQSQGSYELAVNADNLQLAKGLYFLKLTDDKGSAVMKIIVN
jgi:spore germination protein YaaH